MKLGYPKIIIDMQNASIGIGKIDSLMIANKASNCQWFSTNRPSQFALGHDGTVPRSTERHQHKSRVYLKQEL